MKKLLVFTVCLLTFITALKSAENAPSLHLVFRKNGQPVCVMRTAFSLASGEPAGIDSPEDARRIVRAIRLWMKGPDAAERRNGLESWLPVQEADSIRCTDGRLELFVTLPERFLRQELTWEYNDAVLNAIAGMIEPGDGVSRISVMARTEAPDVSRRLETQGPSDPRERHSYLPLDAWIPAEPQVPAKPHEDSRQDSAPGTGRLKSPEEPGWNWPGQPGAPGQGMYPGSLSGKSVFLSQSHGWYSNGSYWLTQRPNTNDIVEDFINAEAIDQYLVHYLYNAGAGVYTCRERDMNPVMEIVDNSDADYDDTGSWSTSTSTSGYYGSNYRTHPVTTSGHGYATWTLQPPEAGFYEVYVWYTGGSNRAVDAHYTIRHNGGETVVVQNQQRDGYTWKSIGCYAFDPSDPAVMRQVRLSSEGSVAGQYVIADAVRIGGGMGSIADPVISNRPRWEESGRYFAEYMGCSTCGTSTVSSMPRYAAWENESWEDSLYFSWHTNAPNPGTGTSSYIHDSAPYPNSDVLQDWIHDEIINDIRTGYDAGWQDRGKLSANFGEVNTANNNEMPALLIELAFHDTPSDALCLKDPKFRMLASRAIYQGIEKFFAWKDGRSAHLLPEPPGTFYARNSGSGIVTLSWTEPPANTGNDLLGDPATGYRVYVSESGMGFDDAIVCSGTSIQLGPFPAGSIRFFRISATNTGGESFPTPVLCLKIPASGESTDLLIVDAFDRLDRYALIPQYESSALGTDLRMFLDRMNTFSYAVTHGLAAADFPAGFDSCANEVIAAGVIGQSAYRAVDWIAGEDSTVDESVSTPEQSWLTGFLNAGGGLFISGDEVTWDLDAYGSTADRDFCHGFLKASYVLDDAGSDTLLPVTGGIFDGMNPIVFDYELYQIYAADYPDGISPINGSTTALTYETGYTAAVVFDDSFRVITMGMPFETILSASGRSEMMVRILDFLIPDSVCLNHGDVNFSGSISASDAQMAFYIVLGLIVPTLAEECAADCDGDGQVTAGDAQMIFFVALGQEPSCADVLT